jgi:hypothetical protein
MVRLFRVAAGGAIRWHEALAFIYGPGMKAASISIRRRSSPFPSKMKFPCAWR